MEEVCHVHRSYDHPVGDKFRRGRKSKIESLTKQGKVVAYEAKVLKAGKRHEVQVGPDGKPLKHPE
jgi:hypothetical protein